MQFLEYLFLDAHFSCRDKKECLLKLEFYNWIWIFCYKFLVLIPLASSTIEQSIRETWFPQVFPLKKNVPIEKFRWNILELVSQSEKVLLHVVACCRKYKLPMSHIIPFPKRNDTSSVPDFPNGKQVLAVYPGTTALYKATVVNPHRKVTIPSVYSQVMFWLVLMLWVVFLMNISLLFCSQMLEVRLSNKFLLSICLVFIFYFWFLILSLDLLLIALCVMWCFQIFCKMPEEDWWVSSFPSLCFIHAVAAFGRDLLLCSFGAWIEMKWLGFISFGSWENMKGHRIQKIKKQNRRGEKKSKGRFKISLQSYLSIIKKFFFLYRLKN